MVNRTNKKHLDFPNNLFQFHFIPSSFTSFLLKFGYVPIDCNKQLFSLGSTHYPIQQLPVPTCFSRSLCQYIFPIPIQLYFLFLSFYISVSLFNILSVANHAVRKQKTDGLSLVPGAMAHINMTDRNREQRFQRRVLFTSEASSQNTVQMETLNLDHKNLE